MNRHPDKDRGDRIPGSMDRSLRDACPFRRCFVSALARRGMAGWLGVWSPGVTLMTTPRLGRNWMGVVRGAPLPPAMQDDGETTVGQDKPSWGSHVITSSTSTAQHAHHIHIHIHNQVHDISPHPHTHSTSTSKLPLRAKQTPHHSPPHLLTSSTLQLHKNPVIAPPRRSD